MNLKRQAADIPVPTRDGIEDRSSSCSGSSGSGAVPGPTISERAARVDWASVQAILDRVPDVPPMSGDQLQAFADAADSCRLRLVGLRRRRGRITKVMSHGLLKEPRRLPPLLRRAWYGLNQVFRQRTAHLGITPDQYSILRWLSEGDPAGLTQRQITELMASDPNTITSILVRMEKAELLRREPHERDRRANRVTLLPAGAEAFARAKAVALKLQAQVLTVLPEERREAFLEELEIIANACADAADPE